MAFSSVISFFTSFVPGLRLVDGGELLKQANLLFGYQDGLTALAGGGALGATPLIAGSNRLTVVVTGADSTLLPPAIPYQQVVLTNDGLASARTFPCQSNSNNSGVADEIAPHGSSVYGASADTANQDTSIFFCVTLGKWKQALLT